MQTTAVVRDGLSALVDRGRETGVIDPGLDANEAAAWIQTIVDGAFLSSDPDRDPRPMLLRIVTALLTAPHSTEGEPS